jgi:hypothetical protein
MLLEWGCACPAQDKSGSISGHDRADLGSGHVLEAGAAGLAAWHDVYLDHWALRAQHAALHGFGQRA